MGNVLEKEILSAIKDYEETVVRGYGNGDNELDDENSIHSYLDNTTILISV